MRTKGSSRAAFRACRPRQASLGECSWSPSALAREDDGRAAVVAADPDALVEVRAVEGQRAARPVQRERPVRPRRQPRGEALALVGRADVRGTGPWGCPARRARPRRRRASRTTSRSRPTRAPAAQRSVQAPTRSLTAPGSACRSASRGPRTRPPPRPRRCASQALSRSSEPREALEDAPLPDVEREGVVRAALGR